CVPLLTSSRPVRAADPAAPPAVRDGTPPRLRAAPARLNPRRGAPHLKHDLLGDLLGLERVAQNAAYHAEHGRPRVRAYRLERCLVTAGHVAEKRLQVGDGRSSGTSARPKS